MPTSLATPIPDSSRLLSMPEVAERIGCCRDHVYTLIAAGHLAVVDIARPGAKKTKHRVTEDSLLAYISGNAIQAGSR